MYHPDIICVVETWLDPTIDDFEISIQGYCVHRVDRNRHGGGVLVFIKDVFTCSLLYRGTPEFELIILTANASVGSSPDFCIALFFRPPSSDHVLLDTLFSTLCNFFISLPCKVILLGDFNVDCLSPFTCLYRKLLSVVSFFNLSQVVKEPTRVASTYSTLIDLIFVSPSVCVNQCHTIPPLANSDHLGLHLDISSVLPPKRMKPVIRQIWRYALGDFEKAAELLETIEWSRTANTNDVDSYWSDWKSYFLQVMEICIPSVKAKTRNNVPCMNHSIAKAIKQRDVLFRTAKRTYQLSDLKKYKLQRNKVVSMLRKQLFFDKLSTSDQKTFWKTVRFLNNKQSSIQSLQRDGNTIVSASGKAELLNNFFFGCFNHNVPPLMHSDIDISCEYVDLAACPEDILCTKDFVLEQLTNLDVTKATGCDGISARMLKSTAVSIAPSLTELFNMSISTGVYPSDWKVARIVPVPKGTDQSLVSGYRPISILPVVSKLVEQHVKLLIEDHLQNNAPISSHQWGFISSRSSVSALIRVIDALSLALDQGFEVCMIFFDVSKAFDTVPHVPLLDTLENLNIDRYLLRWITSYLLNRSQSVAVEGYDSSVLPVVSGVPQGSVLGPLLFITYINNVTSVVSTESELNLFADDIALYRIIKTTADYTQLQNDIDSISSFISGKHLKFNAKKCRQMLVSRKTVHSLPSATLTIDGTPLTLVTEYKYLGVTIASNLSWNLHITNICNKTRRLVGMFYRRFYTNSSPETC